MSRPTIFPPGCDAGQCIKWLTFFLGGRCQNIARTTTRRYMELLLASPIRASCRPAPLMLEELLSSHIMQSFTSTRHQSFPVILHCGDSYEETLDVYLFALPITPLPSLRYRLHHADHVYRPPYPSLVIPYTLLDQINHMSIPKFLCWKCCLSFCSSVHNRS